MARSAPSDPDLRQTLLDRLNTAVVGDCLDKLGYHHQFLAPGLSPLSPSRNKLVGRAFTVNQETRPTPTNRPGPDDKPFGLLFEALDDLKEGEVYLATEGPGPGEVSPPYALFGGLMATRARHLKAAGAVLDGYVRDSEEIERLGFTVFSRGLYAQDQGARGRVTAYRCEVKIGEVVVRPGDLVFADCEGVVVIPTAVEEEVVARALEKVGTEGQVESAIKKGMGAAEAYRRFGVF